MQAHIAVIIYRNSIIASKSKDPGDDISQDRAPQVADMKRLMGIEVGKFHHPFFPLVFTLSEIIRCQNGIHYP